MRSFFTFQIILFLSISIFFLYISRKYFSNTKRHGFYRIFVFEFSSLLVIINIPYWVTEPLSILQIISWISLLISIYLILYSAFTLNHYGGSNRRENEPTNYNFENTTALVQTGVYKFIRHPMYASLFYLSVGALLKNISIISAVITLLTIVFLIFTAKTEEQENIKYFGDEYLNYIKRTIMFIPFIF